MGYLLFFLREGTKSNKQTMKSHDCHHTNLELPSKLLQGCWFFLAFIRPYFNFSFFEIKKFQYYVLTPWITGSGTARIFQLNGNKSEKRSRYWLKNFRICLSYACNTWPKHFSHCSTSGSVAPSSMHRIWSPLVIICWIENLKKKLVWF